MAVELQGLHPMARDHGLGGAGGKRTRALGPKGQASIQAGRLVSTFHSTPNRSLRLLAEDLW